MTRVIGVELIDNHPIASQGPAHFLSRNAKQGISVLGLTNFVGDCRTDLGAFDRFPLGLGLLFEGGGVFGLLEGHTELRAHLLQEGQLILCPSAGRRVLVDAQKPPEPAALKDRANHISFGAPLL